MTQDVIAHKVINSSLSLLAMTRTELGQKTVNLSDKFMNEDLRPIITNWPYKPGKISVRKIMGDDGKLKIQMRVDLGVLQLELSGRPDGQRPNDCENYLEYYHRKLEDYSKEHQTDIGFELNAEDSKKLRDEALMYYHRYLSCFILEDFEQVIEDTHKNLRIFDLCNRYSAKKSDRMALEQYRPYVIMMNTRAKAELAAKVGKIPLALKHIKAGLKTIKKLYDDVDQSDDFPFCPEVEILKEVVEKFRKKLPADPMRMLEKKLAHAVETEDYEEAAKLRDQMKKLKETKKKKA